MHWILSPRLTRSIVLSVGRSYPVTLTKQKISRSITSSSSYHIHHTSSTVKKFTVFTITATTGILFGTALYCQSSSSSSSSSSSLPPTSNPLATSHAIAPHIQELHTILQAIVGKDNLIINPEELYSYGQDLYSFHSGPPPDCVILPKTTQQVSEIVRICSSRRIPIVPRGAGTSLEGHVTTPYHGVVIDLTQLDTVDIHPDDMDVRVGAGIRWEQLNRILLPYKLFYPMDPGPGASIGGMCGTGCSGTNAVRYGTMKQHVLSLTVVLPDGRIIKTGNRARKSVAGYDLTSLFIGSEGTLGIITEVTLKLSPLPDTVAVGVAAFPSIRSASQAVTAIIRQGIQMGAVELLDSAMIKAVNQQSGFQYDQVPHLFFKFTGSNNKVNDDIHKVRTIINDYHGSDFKWAENGQERDRLWEARKVALWSAAAMNIQNKIATTDVCVPVSRLPDLMATAEEEMSKSSLAVYAVAHAGDGNAHHFISFNPNKVEEVEEAKRLNEMLVTTAISMEGTCTGEHGVGVGKIGYLESELGEGMLSLMQQIKRSIDPLGILNPGKKVPFHYPYGGKKTSKKPNTINVSIGESLHSNDSYDHGALDEDMNHQHSKLSLLGLSLNCDCEYPHKPL